MGLFRMRMLPAPNASDSTYNLWDAARELGVHPETVREMLKKMRLGVKRAAPPWEGDGHCRKGWRITPAEVEILKDSQRPKKYPFDQPDKV